MVTLCGMYPWLPMGRNRTLQSCLPESWVVKTNASLLHMSILLLPFSCPHYSLASTATTTLKFLARVTSKHQYGGHTHTIPTVTLAKDNQH